MKTESHAGQDSAGQDSQKSESRSQNPEGEFKTKSPFALGPGQQSIAERQQAALFDCPLRKINTHKVNLADELIEIVVMDGPGPGNANHDYRIYWPQADGLRAQSVKFQKGAIREAGVNGLTHEVLLAIVIDRLECFQSGPYACEENAEALSHAKECLDALHARTLKRIGRGVEGTHAI